MDPIVADQGRNGRRPAARRLGTRDLAGCIMHSSSPPCPMCEAAAYWARISRLIQGAGMEDGGRPHLTRF